MIYRIKNFFLHFPFFIFLLVGFLVFSNILFNHFVWLDFTYLLYNSHIDSASLTDLFKGSTLTAEGYYRPLSAMILTFQKNIFRQQAFYYHFFQLFLRVINVSLFYLLMKKFFSKGVSIFLSLVYLTHPLNVTQVAFISSIADQLFMTFGLSGLIISIQKKIKMTEIFSLFTFLLLSILSKESGFLFFVPLLFYQITLGIKRFMLFLIPVLITSGIYYFIRFYFASFEIPEFELYPMYDMNLIQRLINVPKILFFYFTKFIIPLNIGGIHIWIVEKVDFNSFYLPLFIAILVFLLVIILFIYIKRKRRRYLFPFLFFSSFFFVGLAMLSHIIPLDYTVAGRWFSFPMIGVLGMVGIILDRRILLGRTKIVCYGLALIIIMYLSIFTFIRNATFKDNITLFTKWAENDNNYAVQIQLASAYLNENDLNNALYHTDLSISMLKTDNNLSMKARILDLLGQKEMALNTVLEALETDNYAPNRHSTGIYIELLNVLMRNKEYVLAKKLLNYAVIDYPANDLFTVLNNRLNDIIGY